MVLFDRNRCLKASACFARWLVYNALSFSISFMINCPESHFCMYNLDLPRNLKGGDYFRVLLLTLRLSKEVTVWPDV